MCQLVRGVYSWLAIMRVQVRSKRGLSQRSCLIRPLCHGVCCPFARVLVVEVAVRDAHGGRRTHIAIVPDEAAFGIDDVDLALCACDWIDHGRHVDVKDIRDAEVENGGR